MSKDKHVEQMKLLRQKRMQSHRAYASTIKIDKGVLSMKSNDNPKPASNLNQSEIQRKKAERLLKQRKEILDRRAQGCSSCRRKKT